MALPEKAQEAIKKHRYKRVLRSNRGNYYIEGVGYILDDQYKMLRKSGVIDNTGMFDTKLFKEKLFRSQFATDYHTALECIKLTGKYPDDSVPPKEVDLEKEKTTWNNIKLTK